MNRLVVSLSALLVAPAALAGGNPMAPGVLIEGLTEAQTNEVRTRTFVLLKEAQQKFGKLTDLPSLGCAFALLAEEVVSSLVAIEAPGFDEVHRKTLARAQGHLREMADVNCGRGPGGGLGTGNAGDRLVFRYAARTTIPEAKAALTDAVRAFIAAGAGVEAAGGAAVPVPGLTVPQVSPHLLPNPVKRTDPREVL